MKVGHVAGGTHNYVLSDKWGRGAAELVESRKEKVSESGESVSDENSTSFTVVLYGNMHQSQVIYSHPWQRSSPFSHRFELFVNSKQKGIPVR